MKKLLFVLVLTMASNAMAIMDKQDDLIKDEMAAVENYKQVLAKVIDEKEMLVLQAIQKDHMKALETLRKFSSKDMNQKTKTPGIWGNFTRVYTGGANLFGNRAAVRVLHQIEKHGADEYIEALKDKKITQALKEEIRTNLLPKQEEHVKSLAKYL